MNEKIFSKEKTTKEFLEELEKLPGTHHIERKGIVIWPKDSNDRDYEIEENRMVEEIYEQNKEELIVE